ncbi:MAG: hypothetical protein ACXVBJ_08105 [Flavisolibacter sp.]
MEFLNSSPGAIQKGHWRVSVDIKKPPREEAGEKRKGTPGCRKHAGSDRTARRKRGNGRRNQNGRHNSGKGDGNWLNDDEQQMKEAFA